MMRTTAFPVLVLCSLLAVACQRQTAEWSEPRTVSSAQRPTQWGASTKERLGLSDMRQPAAAGGERQFVGETPAGWSELPGQPARFRDRIWQVGDDPDAECYLTNAVGGGVAGNLARWYGQFGIQEPAAVESLPVIEFAGGPGRLLELTGAFSGKPGYGMLLAFSSRGDMVTTLKFTGPEATVNAHRDEFLALAKSLRASTASPMPQAPPIERGQQLPSDHPPIPGGAERDTSPPPQPFTAAVPAGWTPVPGSQRLLHHSFGAEGEIYVSQLGGGLRPMLDIWRGEVGAGPATDEQFAAVGKVPMLGGEAALLDVAGDFRSMSGKEIPGARMLVAALEDGGSITFAKLVGRAADVEAQRPAFLEFCASMRRRP